MSLLSLEMTTIDNYTQLLVCSLPRGPDGRTTLDYTGLPWTLDCAGRPWFTLEDPGLTWASLDYLGRPWTYLDYTGLSWTIVDYPGLPWTTLDYSGLSFAIMALLNRCFEHLEGLLNKMNCVFRHQLIKVKLTTLDYPGLPWNMLEHF